MYLLVSYDVSTEASEGRRRLRRLARTCLNFGQRVQKSVFECSVDEQSLFRLKQQLLEIIDEDEDSLRIYRIAEPHEEHIEEYGTNRSVDFDGPLIA